MFRRLFSNSQRLDLTEGNVLKNIWVLAYPMMLGNILQTAFNVVDMIWVGRLGPEAIASVAISGVVLLVIITLIIGVATGTQSLVARFCGAKNQAGAENVAIQALIIGAILSIVLAGLGLIFTHPILRILGARDTVLQLGTDYLKLVLTGGLMLVYLFLISAIFQAAGDAFTPMLIVIGATILNVLLDPLMIFGIGFPRMGVSGAALATVLSRGLAVLVGLYILFQGHSRLPGFVRGGQARLRLSLAKLQLDIRTMGKIIKLGFPNSIQMALRSIVGLVLMAIVARYGEYAVAAYGIGLRVFSLVLMPGFALATSAATLVGQNLGARKPSQAKAYAWSCASFNILLMGLAGVFFFVFSANLIAIFNTHPAIVKWGSEYLRITSFGYIFIALGLVLGRSLMGAGDTISPMLISAFSLLGVQIPLAFILPNHVDLGISGVWWAILISSILQGALITFWFKIKRY